MRIGRTTLRNYTVWCKLGYGVESDAAEGRAWERIHRVVEEDPAEGLRGLTMVAQAPNGDEWALGCLGADPLEDLFRVHADVLLNRLEQQLPSDEPLRVAAGSIWLHRHEPYLRLREAIGLPAPTGRDRSGPRTTGSDAPRSCP